MNDSSARSDVSVVIPAYNAEAFISKTIESALAQTCGVAEIIVVDDGSTDRTAQISAAFPKTRVIRRPNGGQGAARNTGVQAASAEWIAFLDHDDTWHPRKTEIQLRYAAPGVGVIHASRFDPITFGALWHRQAHITPSGALVRKQTLIEVGGFDESREVMGVEDLNLWLRIALTDWRFVRSETGLFKWQTLTGNQSSNDLKMARAELANVDRIGLLVDCAREEADVIRQAIRLEYARNLIGRNRIQEALQLVGECSPSFAARFLKFAAFTGMRRLARVDVLKWLLVLERRNGPQSCSRQCTLTEDAKAKCASCGNAPAMRP